MKHLLVIFSLILFLSSIAVKAQYQETIASDRPGQTYSATTVGKGVFQFQHGLSLSGYGFKTNAPSTLNEQKVRYLQYGASTDIRYGILERWEVGANLIYPFHQSTFVDGDKADNYFESDLNIILNTRLNVTQQLGDKGFNFSVLVAAQVHPLFESGISTINILGLLSKQFGKHGLSGNIGLASSTVVSDRIPYTLNYTYGITDRVGVFIENYGFYALSQQGNSGFFSLGNVDLGFMYLINQDIQLDFAIGYEEPSVFPHISNDGMGNPTFIRNFNSALFYSGLGLSWRI